MTRDETRTESTGSDDRANTEQGNGDSREQQQPGKAGHGAQTQPGQEGAGQPATHGRSGQNRTGASGSEFTLFAASLGILGVIFLWSGIQVYSVGSSAVMYGGGSSLQTVGVVLAGIGVADLVAAYGLWSLKPWGWTAGMGVLGLGVLTSLYTMTQTGSGGLLGLLVYGSLFWYLSTKQSLFRELTVDQSATSGNTASRQQHYTNQNAGRTSGNGRTD